MYYHCCSFEGRLDLFKAGIKYINWHIFMLLALLSQASEVGLYIS